MKEEKYRLSDQADGKAKIVLAGAIDNRHIVTIMLLLAVGIAIHFVSTELLQPVFAERYLTPLPEASSTQQVPAGNSYYRSMSESMAVVASYGSGSANSPMSYQRSMSESMSVTTVQGKPTNSYSRSMSEQVSLSTGMPSAPMQPARINAEGSGGSSYSLSNLRSDERSRILGKGNNALGRIAGSGTSIYSSGSNQGITEDETASFDIISRIFRRTSSGDDGSDGESSQESDSNSNNFVLDYTGLDGKFLEKRLAAGNVGSNTSNFIGYYYVNVINGFYSIGVIAIVAKRSRIILRSRHKLAKTAELVGFTVESKASRACLVVLVLFIVIAVAGSFGALPIDAVFADDALASAYVSATGTFGTKSAKYREWNPITSTWSSEVELPDTGSPISSVKILFSPINSMRVIISYSNNGALNLFTCSSACTTASSWTRVGGASFATAALPSSNPSKPYDIAFEQSSGRLVIVYDKDLNEENDFYYRTFNGATISAESGLSYIGLPLLGDSEFIRTFKMASKPGADEIVMILEDVTNQDAYAFVWNSGSSSFGNQFTVSSAMGTTSVAGFAIDVAYETSSGAAVVFAGNGANSAAYVRWDGAWPLLFASTTDPNPLSNNDVRFVTLKADPVSTSNKIMICQVDDLSDLTCAQIDGGVLGAWTKHDDNVDNTSRRVFDFAWNPTGSAGVLVWGTTSGSIHYRQWSGTVWSTAFYAVPYANTKAWVVGTTNPMSRKSAFLVLNGASDIGSLIYDGLELKVIGTQTHTADTASVLNEALSIDYQRRPAVRAILESVFVSDSVGNRADNPAAIVYRSNTGANGLHSVKYREWNPTTSTWSTEVELPTTGNDVRDAKILFSPTSTLRAVVSHSADGSLNLFTCSSACTTAGSWTRVGGASFADTGSPIGDVPYRPYDIAFEQSSGKLVIVYDKDLTENNDFYYRMFSGGILSSETGFSYIGGAADSEEIRYFKLASKAGSNELTMILEDATNTDTYAFIWNSVSGTFGNQKTVSTALSTANTEGESIGAAYETSSGASVVFSGNGANSAAYARWNGASWSAVSTTDPNTNSGNDVRFVTLKADPVSTSNKIMICQVDDLSDLTCAQIDGGVLGAWTSLNANLDSSTSRPADYVWDSSGSTGLAVYGTTTDVITKRAWDGANWSGATSVDSVGTHLWIVLVRNPLGSDKNKALMGMINSNADIGTMVYDGTNVKNLGDSIHTAFLTNMDFEAVSIDFQRYGRVISRPININLAVTDAISVAFTRQVSEQLHLTGTINRTLGSPYTRSMSDQMMTVTDILARSVTLSRSISEVLAVNDGITKNISKSMTDQLRLTDSIQRTVVAARAFSEGLGVTEKITKALSKTITQQLTLTEAIARSTTASKSITEQLAIQDTIAKAFAPSRSLSENLAVTETTTRTIVTSRALSEQITLTETVAKSISVSLSEQLTTTDQLARATITSRAVTEQLTTAEFIANLVSKAISEQLSITENIARSIVTARSVSEELGLTESVAKRITHSLSEDLSVTDTIDRSSTLSRSISEQLALTETALINTSKPLTEQLAVIDSLERSITTTRTLSEQLGVTDAVSKAFSTALLEQLGITESPARVAALSRSMSEQFTLVDSISKDVSVLQTEQLAFADTLTRITALTRAMMEQLAVNETMTISISKSMSEQLRMTDELQRSISVTAAPSEQQLALTDSIAISLSKSLSEQLEVEDTIARSIALSRSISEELTVNDQISKAISKVISEDLAVTDEIQRTIVSTRNMSEQLGVTDTVTKAISVVLLDQLGVTESEIGSIEVARSMSEQLTITDFLIEGRAFQIAISEQLSSTEATTATTTTSLPSSLIEGLATSDAITTTTSTFARAITENMAITENASRTASIIILEILQTSDQFTDISIHYHLVLGETLVLPDSFATDHASYVNSFIGHKVIIEDSVLLALKSTNNPTEQLVVQDQLSAMHTNRRVLTETMQLRDSRIIVATRPPPSPPSAIVAMPVVTMTEKETVKEYPNSMTSPMVAVQVQGTYPMERLDNTALGSLLTTIGMPVYDVSTEASSTGIDNMTMILPTFKVPIEMDGAPLNGGAFLTPVLSNVPANTQVVIPIDVEGSLGAGTIETNRMILSFTPKVNSSNFALLISILDNNPEEAITQEEPEGLSAFYIDVSYVGTWPGGISPSDPAFYFEPPQVTFTITEEWTEENHAKRDLNNIPMINLFLLNEVTGTWIEISDDKITPLTSAVGNVYQYIVTLPHLSTYVVTADTSSSESGNRGPGSGIGTRGSSRFGHIVQLAESLSVSGSINLVKGESLFSDLTGSFNINKVDSKPLDQRVISVDDISVTVHVSGIRSSAILGTAVARLNFEIENKGDIGQELMLRYWYSDPTTKMRIYENKETVMVGAGQSIVKIFEVPFTSPGDYSLVIEVESKEGTVSTTDIAINVPWLTVYLYILVIIAVIVIGVSMGFVIFAIRSRRFIITGDDR
ncbi:putative cell wall-anchored protein [Candidatus Nitrososphaera gargensis Ga9.2]|uniref:Putative cell wall-anchored protein n=1 Tax=Nitrososphaera gargensis (strain Ga9.2) TaxID=1237085 RepID=K0IDP2_NITGG|nr:cell wall-anchored protein [Candidatus Nitrososphaera gargensis]AFU57825.1 putative cell wall-anchored protein [Candidatus Nitrososphaera gargensis Ga9.2]